MKVDLAYGTTGLAIDVPDTATVLLPKFIPGIKNVNEALVEHFESPIGQGSLRESVHRGMKVVILHTDITRATPNRLILPVLLNYLESHGIAREDIVLLNSLGTHRFQTQVEMMELLGDEIIQNYQCLQHDCHSQDEMIVIGESRLSHPMAINRHVVGADLRILTGFIEPHFFAGFSGGPKAVLPGAASAETIQNNHGYAMIASPSATFGVTIGNPIWEEMMAAVSALGASFLLNVTLNTKGQITNIFTGDVYKAHQQGCAFVKECSMTPVERPFDIVVTTNSGYPLDQNLYQSIKGLSAANQIVRNGGVILLASRCIEGLPEHGGYAEFLRETGSIEAVIASMLTPGFSRQDQWQIQVQARVQQHAEVFVFSEGLSDQEIRQALFQPCASIEYILPKLIQDYGERICILPNGPLTIPYIAE